MFNLYTPFESILAGVARHFLTAWGATLFVTPGYMTGKDSDAAVGALMFLGGLAWSAYQKWHEKQAAKQDKDAAVTRALNNLSVAQQQAQRTAVKP